MPNGQFQPGDKRICNTGLIQSYKLRDLAAKTALDLQAAPLDDGESRSQRASALASLIRAWDAASERMRLIRGRPLPGTLSAAERAKRRQPTRRTAPAAAPRPAPQGISSSAPTVPAGDGGEGAK